MLKIGVTGGIGSGKTVVTDRLEELGFTVLDADRIAHEITAPGGKAIPYIREHFGDEMIAPDGSLDRAKMREKVYGDPESRKVLERGTTAVIISDVSERLEACERRGDEAAFVAAPLLFESGMESDYDETWLVVTDLETRIQRICRRDGITSEMAQKIIKVQMPDEEKIRRATIVIRNTGTIEDLRAKVDAEIARIGAKPVCTEQTDVL